MLKALGNLGDFIGGLAVVATLAYLAIQVRQNTVQLSKSSALTTLQAQDAVYESFSRFRAQLSSSAEVAELYLKGLRDPGSLSPVERLRFNMLVQELFYILQTSLRRITTLGAGKVDDTIRALNLDTIVNGPGIVQWWESNKRGYPADFVAVVDARISNGPPAA